MKPRLLCYGILLGVATLAAAEEKNPQLDLRLNGRSGGSAARQIESDEPLVAEVELRVGDRAATQPTLLDSPAGPWPTRIALVVTDENKQTLNWVFQVIGETGEPALTLQPRAVTTLVLRLDPATVKTPGQFKVVAKLSLPDGRGWRGTVSSEPVSLQIVAPTNSADSETSAKKQLARAGEALLAHDVTGAQDIALGLLQKDPKRPEGFVTMALVYEAQKDRKLAIFCIDLAIAHAVALRQTTAGSVPVTGGRTIDDTPASPPFEYIDLRRRFEAMPDTP